MPSILDPRLADPVLLRLAGQALQRRKQAQVLTAQADVPVTDDALWDYVWTTWGVAIPRQQVCLQHTPPFTVFANAFFARASVIVVKASRGLGGKSFWLAYLGLAQAHLLGASVTILGGSFTQSANIHRYMTAAWQYRHAPREALDGEPTVTKTRFKNGAEIEAIPASQRSARGPHPSRAIQDEADEMDLQVHEAAMGQAMPQHGVPACTVISSTHQYPEGTFSTILKKAQEKGWPSYEYCYRETIEPHGWLSPATVAQKRNDMTAEQWMTEVEGQEPSSENRAIDPAAVEACFQAALGWYQGREREYVEAEAPQAGALYAHGADWAKQQDFTEIVTLRTDALPLRLVAYERMHRLPWPQMVGRFDARLLRYKQPGQRAGQAQHDKTGLGDVVDGYLTEDATGLVLAGRARADLFSECVSALENGEIVSPLIDSLKAQVQYCTVADLYGAGHPPDGFVALALAYRAYKATPTHPGVGWL